MLKYYSKQFIDLQLQFANRLVALTDWELGKVLAEHTVLRHLLDVSISLDDQSDPIWQAFVHGVSTRVTVSTSRAGKCITHASEWAYEYYHHHPAPEYDSDLPRFGCFYGVYPFRGTPAVRMHFENLTNTSVLNQESVAARQSELKKLFTYIRQHHPDAERVRGGSWLYNIEAYRRLFPPEYIATAAPVGYETGFFALWGQFLRADGTVRESAATQFLHCIAQQQTVDGCLTCFPYQVLRPECPIGVFYKFYAVSTG